MTPPAVTGETPSAAATACTGRIGAARYAFAARSAAGPHLQRVIIAALETGCRRGELLSLTWRDVNLERREVTILAERAKTRTGRVLPISERLLGVLKMAQLDPAGKPFPPEAHVFGDGITGAKVNDIKRAWETCCLKAHGHTPVWSATMPSRRRPGRR